jgi:hypothetical protein
MFRGQTVAVAPGRAGRKGRIPVISDAADRWLVRKLTKQLQRYGYAEFTTNAATYRPAHT